MTQQKEREFDDFDQDKRPIANVGKRFYTWATLGSFAGATFLVCSLWDVCQRLGGPGFEHEKWPMIFSVVVVGMFAFATEPSKKQHTNWNQKIQKGLIAVANILLVFFMAVGGKLFI